MCEEELIELVRQRPALWDKECSEYFDANLRPVLWGEIFNELREFFKSKAAVTKRWESLRDGYRRGNNKKLKSKSGDGLKDAKKREQNLYKFAKQMSFLEKNQYNAKTM